MPWANARKTKGNAAGGRAGTVLTATVRLGRGVDAGELKANRHNPEGGHGVHWRTGMGLGLACEINWQEPGQAHFQQNQHDVHVSTISL
jgi:hypothetical protein